MLVVVCVLQHLLMLDLALEWLHLLQHHLQKGCFANPIRTYQCDPCFHVHCEIEIAVEDFVSRLAEFNVTHFDECAHVLGHIHKPKFKLVILV